MKICLESSLQYSFKRWIDRGIWEQLMQYVQVDKDLEATMLDTTIIRAHVCSSGYKKDSHEQESLGRSKGGFTTKIKVVPFV